MGCWPSVSLADAREQHSALLRGIADGKSPADQRRAAKQISVNGITVEVFAQKWLKEQVARVRKKPDTVRRYLERDVLPEIGKKPLACVEKKELREIIFAKIADGHEQAALAIRNLLKRMWDYAVECEVTETNPAAAIKAKFIAPIASRSRALNERELGAFLQALDMARIRDEMKDALMLILLTLVRKSELRLARWREFDLDRAEWALPMEHSKMETPLVIPLSRQAVTLLLRQRERHPNASIVFPMRDAVDTPIAPSTLNRALARIPLKIDHFTVHDLRRSAATNLAEHEYNEAWIEKALNHNKKGVAGIYNRAQYATQRRTMLQSWADRLDSLAQTGANQQR